MLTELSGVAQCERNMMFERQREDVAKAKAAGKYKGRKLLSSERLDAVLQFATLGTTQTSIARQSSLGKLQSIAFYRPFDLSSLGRMALINEPESQMALLSAMWSLPQVVGIDLRTQLVAIIEAQKKIKAPSRASLISEQLISTAEAAVRSLLTALIVLP